MRGSTEPLGARNPRVAAVRALLARPRARREAGRFVLEGRRLVLDALAGARAGGPAVHEVLIEASASELEEIVAAGAAASVEVVTVAPGVIERISSTSAPQPVLAVAQLPSTPIGDVLAATGTTVRGAPPILVLLDVADPGNVGTLIRSALAAGAAGAVLAGACADPFGPKAVRASAGAVLHLPVATEGDVEQVLGAMRDHGTRLVATTVMGGDLPEVADLVTGPIALVVGSESHGIAPNVLAGADARVTIPLGTGPLGTGVESLNVAMAGTVVLFESARQRRSGETNWTPSDHRRQGVAP